MDEYSLKVAKAQDWLLRFERYTNYKVNTCEGGWIVYNSIKTSKEPDIQDLKAYLR